MNTYEMDACICVCVWCTVPALYCHLLFRILYICTIYFDSKLRLHVHDDVNGNNDKTTSFRNESYESINIIFC